MKRTGIMALLAVALMSASAMAQPLYLTAKRDVEPNNSRLIFRWKGDGATQYRLWYGTTENINFLGLDYLDIDVSVPGYSACTPAVTPLAGFQYDYTYCYTMDPVYRFFAVTSVTTGTCVYGTITDQNGDRIPGAAVCFTRPSLPDTCVYTNGIGDYVICGLPIADLDVRVSVACEAAQFAGVVSVNASNAVEFSYQLTSVPIVQKSGHITANETWTSGSIYQLFGQVIVDPGVTLTIDAGTRIIGSYPNVGLLILAAGGTDCSAGGGIYAVGTPTNPIVFTSNRPCGLRSNGDWGGIVINGRGHNNRGIVADGEGQSGEYGLGDPCLGNTACDAAPNGSNITLRYVRLEFPGYRFTPTNELNGLCLQGVGAGADISYVQVQRGQDDAVEFFGGAASVHHLVLSDGGDDGFDWTDGVQNAASHVVVHQRMTDSDAGIEADNYEFGHDCVPRAHPYLSNFTIIGGKGTAAAGQNGAVLRRGTEVTINNFVTTLCKNAAFDLDDGSTAINANNGGALGTFDATRFSFDYSLFYDNGVAASEVIDPTTPAGIGDGHFRWENAENPLSAAFPVNTVNIMAPVGWTQDVSDYRSSGSVGTNATNAAANPLLVNPAGAIVPSGFGYDVFTFDARPAAGSPALGGAAPSLPAPPYLPPWWPLPTPSYRGAFSGPTDTWADGWTDYPIN